MRGVMEKCTYCLQRIEHAKIAAKTKAGGSDKRARPGPAPSRPPVSRRAPPAPSCSATSPNPESRVAKLKAQDRNYPVLEFLLTKPRTTYPRAGAQSQSGNAQLSSSVYL